VSFFAELRRRNVFKFGTAYAVVASHFAMKRIGRKFSAMLLVQTVSTRNRANRNYKKRLHASMRYRVGSRLKLRDHAIVIFR